MPRPAHLASTLALGLVLVSNLPAQTSAASPAHAATALPPHTQPVILTVSGNISRRNQGEVALFDARMLDQLEAHTIRTSSPWFREPVTFSGPRLQAVLEAVGAKGTMLHIVALNDYSVDIPISDAERFEPLLARRINGKELSVREKGPLFLIYPFDARPEIRNGQYYGRSIWQITQISVR